MLYRRLTKSVADRGTLIPADKPAMDFIKDQQTDWYLSTYCYNDQQKELFEEHGTIAGITDVVTNKLWWDFDSEHEPELARQNAITLCTRLNQYFDSRDMMISFSGNKGFGIELNLTQLLVPKDVKKIAFDLAKDLEHFDKKMYNASRIFRVLLTKHPKTGLYKTPISFHQLKTLSVDAIFSLAKEIPEESSEFLWREVTLPQELFTVETPKEEEVFEDLHKEYIDYSIKPRFLTNCRWSLQNGEFREGERSTALLCLASSYKNQGFSQEIVYRMLKGVAEMQAKRYGCERFPDVEIYNNIVIQVFSSTWNNGQYSCRIEGNWLYDYCQRLSEHKCDHKKDDDCKPRSFLDIRGSFKEYVKHIGENTIKTGVHSIDSNVFISTGANVGIVGAAGSGKSSIALEILENTSSNNVKSVFASLDMHKNRMFEKVLYRVSGKSRDEVYDLFKQDKEGALMDQVKQKYGNVFFFHKSCPTVDDVRNYIISCQDQSGEKIKLVMLDYFERVMTDISDDTAASKRIAGELQDLVNDLDVALVTLVQPNKNALSGGPDSSIYDYSKIKGSSYLYQSFRIIMSLWRPFYNPQTFIDDKFMQMAVLKNDLGELAEFTFNWNGARGMITEMDQSQEMEFKRLLKEKDARKAQENKFDLI